MPDALSKGNGKFSDLKQSAFSELLDETALSSDRNFQFRSTLQLILAVMSMSCDFSLSVLTDLLLKRCRFSSSIVLAFAFVRTINDRKICHWLAFASLVRCPIGTYSQLLWTTKTCFLITTAMDRERHRSWLSTNSPASAHKNGRSIQGMDQSVRWLPVWLLMPLIVRMAQM